MSKNKVDLSTALKLLDCMVVLREIMQDLASDPLLDHYEEGLWQGVGLAFESFSAILEDSSEVGQPFFDFGHPPETFEDCRLATDDFLSECKRLFDSAKDFTALPAAAMAVRASTFGWAITDPERITNKDKEEQQGGSFKTE